MKQHDFQHLDIEDLKIIPERLEGFKKFCDGYRSMRFKLFSIYSQDRECGYSFFGQTKFKGTSVYSSVCESFGEFNNVLDKVVRDKNRDVYRRYQVTNDKKKQTLGDYSGFIKYESSFVCNEVYKAFEDLDFIRDEIGNKSIPFISEADPFNAFLAMNHRGEIGQRLKEAIVKHEELRSQLWLVSLANAINIYWRYMASITEGEEQIINSLKSEIYAERVEKHLALIEVLNIKINSLLEGYRSASDKAKRGNTKKEEGDRNRENIRKIAESYREGRSDEELYEYLKARKYLISNKLDVQGVKVINKTIMNHLKALYVNKMETGLT